MDSLILIGQRVRALRDIKRLTQKELAEKCGSDTAYIGALERGRKNPTLKILQKIAEGLEVDLMVLFTFDSESSNPSKQSVKKMIDQIPEDKLALVAKILSLV